MAESLPDPPPIELLQGLDPEIHTLPLGARLWRLHFLGGDHPNAWNDFRFYGPTNSRFDHHLEPKGEHEDRGILYAADEGRTCLAECFQRTMTIDKQRDAPHLAVFDLGADVKLLDVMGGWITRAGGNMAIGSGSRKQARAWSRAFYEAYPEIQGIRYASSMDANRPAVALYERAISALPPAPEDDLPLSDSGLAAILADTCHALGYEIASA